MDYKLYSKECRVLQPSFNDSRKTEKHHCTQPELIPKPQGLIFLSFCILSIWTQLSLETYFPVLTCSPNSSPLLYTFPTSESISPFLPMCCHFEHLSNFVLWYSCLKPVKSPFIHSLYSLSLTQYLFLGRSSVNI